MINSDPVLDYTWMGVGVWLATNLGNVLVMPS